jgi:hypothetical protein
LSRARCPKRAALEQVHLSQAQPFSRAHLRASRRPPLAASEHVRLSHGQPLIRAHARTSVERIRRLPASLAGRVEEWHRFPPGSAGSAPPDSFFFLFTTYIAHGGTRPQACKFSRKRLQCR